jgi:hypothetical protein
MQNVSPRKDISSSQVLLKPWSMATAKKRMLILISSTTRFHDFGIDDENIPNLILDFRHVPLFMVKHFVITFNPDGPNCNASKQMPNLNVFAELFGNPFPKQCLLPIEIIILASSSPAKFMHNKK